MTDSAGIHHVDTCPQIHITSLMLTWLFASTYTKGGCFHLFVNMQRCACIDEANEALLPGRLFSTKGPASRSQPETGKRQAVPPWFGRRMARHLDEEGANVTFQECTEGSSRCFNKNTVHGCTQGGTGFMYLPSCSTWDFLQGRQGLRGVRFGVSSSLLWGPKGFVHR